MEDDPGALEELCDSAGPRGGDQCVGIPPCGTFVCKALIVF